MKVTLIGGTGFVGGYLVDALLAAGHSASLLVRPGSAEKLRRAEECRLTEGSVADPVALEATLRDCDAVIYNIGILREIRGRSVTFEATQYRGVEDTIRAASTAGVQRFVLMSANGIKLPGTAYQETKYRAEQALKSSGLDYTIFRPSVIFGDPRGTMEFATQLYRDMIRPPIPAVGFHTGWSPAKGAIPMSPVHVLDVADAFVNVLEDPNARGRTYSLGGPENLTWSEMLERVAGAAGKKKIILPMPVAVMKFGARLFDWLPFFPVTRDQLTMLAEGNTASKDELESLINRDARAFSIASLSYLTA